MAIRYYIFTDNQLAQLQRRAEDLLSLWSEKWLPSTEASPSILSAHNAHELSAAIALDNAVFHLGASIYASKETRHKLYTLLTEDRHNKATHDAADAILDGLVARLLRDLINSFIDQTRSPAEKPPIYKGSGSVLLKIVGKDWALQLLLPQAAALELAGGEAAAPKATLVSRKSGISKGKLKLLLSAGEVEIKLADLSDLAPGQVVRLNLKTDQGFSLLNAETKEKMCDAFLGQRDGKKAIQLIG